MEDSSWDLTAFQERTKPWAEKVEKERHEIKRFQDLSLQLELSDSNHDIHHSKLVNQETSSSWPFESSPCRLFGGRNTRPNNTCKELNDVLFDVDFADHLGSSAINFASEFSFQSESSMQQSSRSLKRRTDNDSECQLINDKRTDRRTSFERSNGSLNVSYSEFAKSVEQETTRQTHLIEVDEHVLFTKYDPLSVYNSCECSNGEEEDEEIILHDNSLLTSSPLTTSYPPGWMPDSFAERETPLRLATSSPLSSPKQSCVKSLCLRKQNPKTTISTRYHSFQMPKNDNSQQDESQTCTTPTLRRRKALKSRSLSCPSVGNSEKHRTPLKRGISLSNVEIPPENHDGNETPFSHMNGIQPLTMGDKKQPDDDDDDDESSTDSTCSSHSLEHEKFLVSGTVATFNSSSSSSLFSRHTKEEKFYEEDVNDEEEMSDDDNLSLIPPERCFRRLFRDRETMTVDDFAHSRNRRILHQLVYQYRLKVDMDDLKAKLIVDKTHCPAGIAIERRPLPLYVKPLT